VKTDLEYQKEEFYENSESRVCQVKFKEKKRRKREREREREKGKRLLGDVRVPREKPE